MSTLPLDIRAISPGFGDDAKKVPSLVKEASSHRLENGTGSLAQNSFERLRGLYKKCKEECWDGIDAVSIPFSAYEDAREFLNNILWEDDIPEPEIDADEVGAIQFEWIGSNRSMFSITFYGEKILGYSGNMGQEYGIKKLSDSTHFSILRDIMRTVQGRGNFPTTGPGKERREYYKIPFSR